MPTYVALLRGINVGKAKRVAMADLRAAIESLGYGDVRTLLNSGNAVFTSQRALKKTAAEELRAALVKKTGISSRFTLRSAAELQATVDANLLLKVATDNTRLFAAFVTDPGGMALVKPVAAQSWKPEAVALGPSVVYVWCPNGLLESKASLAVGKALGDGVTVRNWATVMKLQRLATGDQPSGR
ncbi:MAG TPA: DUF1697 domain-containing protein [Gemmatimonadaceae bacterium]|nr:DUF1697 domain-containing protein [Gemmatimonadaceae bacterium]